METLFGLIIIFGIGKLLFGRGGKKMSREEREKREKQTIFKYPKGGYGLDDDPVMDELFFIDVMEDDD